MGNSICRFVPAKNYTGNIKTVHFVYETEFKTLRQPFLHPIYYAHLVVNGSAVMKAGNHTYPLQKGTLFFAFPGYPYEIVEDDAFKYIYISFTGSCVPTLFENLSLAIDKPVYTEFAFLLDFWKTAITRINGVNANILAESVLLYTLSFMGSDGGRAPLKNSSEELFELIVDYVDMHYRESDLTLKKVADVFSYTDKYLSYLFKKHMKANFNTYVNNLRIQYAFEQIVQGETSVTRMAMHCGYTDPLYFSKVFKKRTGQSPTEYIKKQEKENSSSR